MTRSEFNSIVNDIAVGCGKPLSHPSQEVYFNLLGDLPCEVFGLAAKRVLLEHRWASFPTIAELRAAAIDAQAGVVSRLSPHEAWELAWRAAGRICLEVPSSKDRAMENLPPLVVRAMNAFGLSSLCSSDDPVSVMRAQFLKIYEAIDAAHRREELLPASMQKAIESRRPGVTDQPNAVVARIADALAMEE